MRLALVLVATIVVSRPAEASCGGGTTELWPSPEADPAVLPPNPVLYVTRPLYEMDEPLAIQGAPYRITPVSFASAYNVLRIDVGITTGGFTVIAGRHRYAYAIRAGGSHLAAIVDVTHTESHWTCSYRDTIDFVLAGDPTMLRFTWDDGMVDVVPVEDARASLGHLDCLGWNSHPWLLALGREVAVTALFADGSEQPLGRGEIQLSHDRLRMPRLGLGMASNLEVAVQPVAGSALGGLVALLVFRRRRAR